MSLFSKREITGPTAAELIPPRPGVRRGAVSVTNETALRHSAVWACLRLRANLLSTMPVDYYRRVGGIQIELPKPPVLVNPGGDRVDMLEWLYSTQFDLDRGGNAFGLITARDGMGFPARIDLVPLAEVAVLVRNGVLAKYRIGGTEYDPPEVWHEKQYTVGGLPVGLSPVAYAAWSIGEYLSIQDFALDWFGNGAMPQAQLKNTKKTIDREEAVTAKQIFKASVASGDIFVTGNDWEYNMIQAETAGSAWLEAKQYGVSDIARFFDCPGDLIDAMTSTGNITYASITQRNLQFLIMHLGPAVTRRENALTKLTSRPRYVKLNAGALLRMDAQGRALTLKTQIDARTLTPNEARELEDRPPLTDAQVAEFDRFWPPKAAVTTGGSAPTGATT